MKRVVLFRNGYDEDGKVVLVTHDLQELLNTASRKFNFVAKRIFTQEGGEIDSIDLLRDNDILYVSAGERFIKTEPKGTAIVSKTYPCERDWVTFNVGGKYFITSKSTLCLKEPTSMLARMFSTDFSGLQPSEKDKNGAYLLDRSPCYFEPVLNYLRTSKVIINPNLNPEGVLEEAKYFGVESLVKLLEPTVELQNSHRDKAPLTSRDVINALVTTDKAAELRFQGVNLAGADLSHLDLRNINFKYACLKRCRLKGSNLSSCTLERADLSNAILDGAQLQKVKMLCANLEGASLQKCNFEDPTGGHANMEGVNLKGANLEGSNMAGVHLRVANLKNANLKHCDLRAAVLAGADLENCDLSGSNLHETNLRGANLKGASLELMQTPVHMSQTVVN